MLFYLAILALIYAQHRMLGRKFHPERLLFLANLELVLFFLVAYFVFGGQRLFQAQLLTPFNTTLLTLFSLFLYFSGLFFAQYACQRQMLPKATALAKTRQAVWFLFPFALPFMILVTIGDVASFIPYEDVKEVLGLNGYAWADTVLFIALSLISLLATMIFLPPLLVFIWQCPRLIDPPLVARLEALCQRAHFTHAGFRIWSVMDGSFNAAIVGIVGPCRYIMFTPKLLSRLSSDAIEAILAHEMGHNRHRHLLLYPLILLGMLACGWLASSLIYNSLMKSSAGAWLAAWPPWQELAPLVLFLLFVGASALYFRLIFGYFSRLFERQADLYIFELQLPAKHMIEALDDIGYASGGMHEAPNWHHFSIRQRIDFLTAADKNHSLIARHQRKVRYSLAVYVLALSLAIYLLVNIAYF